MSGTANERSHQKIIHHIDREKDSQDDVEESSWLGEGYQIWEYFRKHEINNSKNGNWKRERERERKKREREVSELCDGNAFHRERKHFITNNHISSLCLISSDG
jgi:hypothetical protein